METFYIDSIAGIHTWIFVEGGIVTKIESSLNPVISNQCVGKSITFLQEIIEKRLYKSWVKNVKLSNIHQKINSVDGAIVSLLTRMHEKRFSNSIVLDIDACNKRIESFELEKQDYVIELNEMKAVLKEIHGYED